MSEERHTAEYLAEVIENVVNGIGADRISAIVSDNASNVRNARKIIQEKFPRIENIRCIAHAINLIACDIVKEKFGDRLLRCVNTLTSFFKNSHQAGSKLAQLIKEKGINGGGLKLYCKTRWTTASESVNSVINLESALEAFVTNYYQSTTANDRITTIVRSRNFFSDLRVLLFVLEPLRKAVLALESRSATLADCFLSLARLAAVIKKLPQSFNPAFRNHCIRVIKKRYEEFDDDNYITCFFLDPRFRHAPLKKRAFNRILKCAASIGQRLGFDRYECGVLCDQLMKYKEVKDPFDLDTSVIQDNPNKWWELIDTEPEPGVLPKVAVHLFAISPNSASCERGFSTLGWLYHKRRLNLKLERLESMCKLITYWKSNFKTELGFYGIDQKKQTRLSNEEINLRIAEAFAEADEEEYDETPPTRRTIDGEEIPEDNCVVLIEDIWIDKLVDLSHELIQIGDIPIDISYDSDEDDKGDDEIYDEEDDEGDDGADDNSGKGVMDYDINDLIGDDDCE